MKYTINVEQKHIDAGEMNCPANCPVSLAIQEQTGFEASVTGSTVFLSIPGWHPDFPLGGRRVVQLSEAVLDFVCRFDYFRPVRPFSFVLDTENIPSGWGWK